MTEQEEKTLKTALRWYMDMYGCRPERNVYDGTVEYSCNGYVTNKEDGSVNVDELEQFISEHGLKIKVVVYRQGSIPPCFLNQQENELWRR